MFKSLKESFQITIQRKESMELFNRGYHDKALTVLKQILTIQRNDRDAIALKKEVEQALVQRLWDDGAEFFAAECDDLATECYKKILELDSAHQKAKQKLSEIDTRQVVALSIQEREKRILEKVFTLQESGRFEEAVTTLQTLTEAGKEARTMIDDLQKRLERASRLFEQAEAQLERK